MITEIRSDLHCCAISDAVVVIAKWSLAIALSMIHFDPPAAVKEQRERLERHIVFMGADLDLCRCKSSDVLKIDLCRWVFDSTAFSLSLLPE